MILHAFRYTRLISLVGLGVAVLLLPQTINAEPSKYPQFVQQTLPENVVPTFIGIEELVADLKAGVRPVIIDVRTAEEYREVHILGAVSAPLEEFKDYLKSIPRDRPVVLY
jgi:Rhodanese-like domain